MAGSARCLHGAHWCWGSVTGRLLLSNEYVNVKRCRFSLHGKLALLLMQSLYEAISWGRWIIWKVIWKAALTRSWNVSWVCLTNRKGHVIFSPNHLAPTLPPVCLGHESFGALAHPGYTGQLYTVTYLSLTLLHIDSLTRCGWFHKFLPKCIW